MRGRVKPVRSRWILVGVLFCAGSRLCLAAETAPPRDLPAGHWANRAVREVVGNGILTVSNGKFLGESIVSRREAAIAIARLGKSLQENTWHVSPSIPVPDKTVTGIENGAWERQSVSRYAFAVMLARMGDFIANGLPRPPASASDLARSVTLSKPPQLKLPISDPAYTALVYLAHGRMIGLDSPLLHPDSLPIPASELGRAFAQLAFGLNDALTPLGHNLDGSTIDSNDHHPKPKTTN